MTNKTFYECSQLKTFKERFEYLKLFGKVAFETYGKDRYINQMLYTCEDWKEVRRKVILRDNGCDLGIENCFIQGKIMVHHIMPITLDDILERNFKVFDLNNLICSSLDTHNAIHYSDFSKCSKYNNFIIRTPYDTCPWRVKR